MNYIKSGKRYINRKKIELLTLLEKRGIVIQNPFKSPILFNLYGENVNPFQYLIYKHFNPNTRFFNEMKQYIDSNVMALTRYDGYEQRKIIGIKYIYYEFVKYPIPVFQIDKEVNIGKNGAYDELYPFKYFYSDGSISEPYAHYIIIHDKTMESFVNEHSDVFQNRSGGIYLERYVNYDIFLNLTRPLD